MQPPVLAQPRCLLREGTKINSQGGKSPLFEMGHPEGWPVGGVRVTLSIGGMYYIAV
jgi:hypothetical protein